MDEEFEVFAFIIEDGNADPQQIAQHAAWSEMYPPFLAATGRPCQDPGCHCGGKNQEMALVFDCSVN